MKVVEDKQKVTAILERKVAELQIIKEEYEIKQKEVSNRRLLTDRTVF